MLGIRIEGEYHWGYWVRVPGTSKQQSALHLPPPTTLIGALAFPLARDGLLKDAKNQNKITGETIIDSRDGQAKLKSVSSIFENAILGAAICLSGKAIMWEDINKYTTLHFQTTTKDKPEEKAAGGRRYLEKYRTGAIYSGKVFYPKGKATVFYVVDENAISEAIQSPWERHLEEACWAISRIGSKESIFSVTKVDLSEILDKGGDSVETKLYFPTAAGEVKNYGKFYRLTFWRGGWGREHAPMFSEYIVPGSNSPISSEVISVKAKGRAYEFASQEVLLLEQ